VSIPRFDSAADCLGSEYQKHCNSTQRDRRVNVHRLRGAIKRLLEV
jgi:hypothetical protein